MQQVFELLVLATRLQDFRNGDSYIVKPAKNSLETILVVEDDPIVLGAVGAILEGAGFCVLTATNSTEAIKKENGYYDTIHLLISDVMMPDMSGPVISKLLKKHRPEMRVMLMSGYPEGDMLFLNDGWNFIQKPFVPQALIAKVNELLHSAQPTPCDQRLCNSAGVRN